MSKMNTSEKNEINTKNSENEKLKEDFNLYQVSLQDACIKLAKIQHVFSNEEFSSLMEHIEALEEAAQAKKRLIGS